MAKPKPKRPSTSRDHDLADVARNVVEHAIGDRLDGTPLPPIDAGKNPAAVCVGEIYGSDPEGEKRCSPAKCLGTTCDVVQGTPNPKHISTSYMERQNPTMRMSMCRFTTRLTNAFSKKVEDHAAAITVYFMYASFGRSLRITLAMAAGVSDTAMMRRKSVGLGWFDGGIRCDHLINNQWFTLPFATRPSPLAPTDGRAVS